MDDLRASLRPFNADAQLRRAPEPWDYLPMPAIRGSAPWAMEEMIAAEPALAARIVRRAGDGSVAALAEAIREVAASGGPVIVTGCGTSEHAAMGVAAILGEAWISARLPGPGPIAAQAFELALDPPSAGLVIGISHEGGTAATIAALEAARGSGARTAVITASAGSPAAAAADIVLATVEMDASWCHTVGYVSPLVAATVAADHLEGRATDGDAASDRLRAGIDAAWGTTGAGTRPAIEAAGRIAERSHLLVVGSGVDRISARELVLKVEEAAWIPSSMRDLETFLHGHLPATGDDTSLVLILTERNAIEARATRGRQALAAAGSLGVTCAAILSADAASRVPQELTPAGRIVVPDAPGMAAAASSLLGAAGPLQLLTLAISAARGTNPDPIRRDQAAYLRAAELADDPLI